jgi:spore maturation protein SpmB
MASVISWLTKAISLDGNEYTLTSLIKALSAGAPVGVGIQVGLDLSELVEEAGPRP